MCICVNGGAWILGEIIEFYLHARGPTPPVWGTYHWSRMMLWQGFGVQPRHWEDQEMGEERQPQGP